MIENSSMQYHFYNCVGMILNLFGYNFAEKKATERDQ